MDNSKIDEKYSREFPQQQCQDKELTKKFRDLHVKIVNEIISFCKENNFTVDELSLHADCLEESIKQGEWCPYTDSQFELDKYTQEYKDSLMPDNDYTKEEIDRIDSKQEPFLFSM